MEIKKHNGYASYETWLVNLWLQNSRGDLMTAREALKKGGHPDSLWDMVEDGTPDEIPGLYRDLIHAALCRVDWAEIAEALTD